MGAARDSFNKQIFAVTVSAFTKDNITYYVASLFTDKKFIPVAQEFITKVLPDENKFVQQSGNNHPPEEQINTAANTHIQHLRLLPNPLPTLMMAGEPAITNHYVKLTKADTELCPYFIDKAVDDARPNTVDAPEYYWSKYVAVYFDVPAPEKWSGVQYPAIYHMQDNTVEKATGKPFFVAIKIGYGGGARPIVVIALNQGSYKQQFPHPNDIDPMLNANRFAVWASDIIGTWQGRRCS